MDVGNRPVTGLRLLLEGTRSNRLAICLQHLASRPMSLPLSDNANAYLSCDSHSCTSHKKVKWNCFSHVCTAPVESDDSVSIVTGAQLQVENNCLLLRLRFSKVIGGTLQRLPEWDQSSNLGQLRNVIFASSVHEKEKKYTPKGGEVTIGSAAYPTGPPSRVQTPSLLRFVDTAEIIRGPEHTPGYWVVSGARFSVQNGKIYLSVKYSLLNFVVPCETAVL